MCSRVFATVDHAAGPLPAQCIAVRAGGIGLSQGWHWWQKTASAGYLFIMDRPGEHQLSVADEWLDSVDPETIQRMVDSKELRNGFARFMLNY